MGAEVLDRLDSLSNYAQSLFDSPHQPIEAPIRAELFGRQRFEQHGRSLARAQGTGPGGRGGTQARFFPRVDANLESLRRAFDYLALTSQSEHYVAPAAEWLLDNFHLIEAQLQQIRVGMPRSYYQRLPKLATQPLAGLPRVYGIAWAYVAHTDSVLNAELFMAFLDAYQEVDQLTLGELWALPTTLRVVLLENLRRVAESIAAVKVAREVAHAAWDAAATLSETDLDALYRAMQSRGLQDGYLTQLWLRLPVERNEAGPALARWTERHCPNGPGLIGEAQAGEAAANLSIGNIVTTLRMIGQVDWADLIEPVSCSLRVLRRLPSFGRESESTRQRITHAMERVARLSGRSECEVAQAVVRQALATSASPHGDADRLADGCAEATAGYYLIGAGQAALAAVLEPSALEQGQGAASTRIGRDRMAWRLPLYLFAVWGSTAGVLALAVQALHRRGWIDPATGMTWMTLMALALMLLPLSEAVMALIHRMLAESTRVQSLPRLDFADGIPEPHRVLVVIPALLTSPAATAALARRLELHWLANREDAAQFALLTDWGDAAQVSLPGDGALLSDAAGHIGSLNGRYPVPEGEAPRFVLLHRPRTWCETEQRWMGWERKRGKLEMLL
ncbi:MAG: cation tolerance protein CutA, partial [Variovorax sp.]|nr:cation tolerance protein CutA [Variovorax sp.]